MLFQNRLIPATTAPGERVQVGVSEPHTAWLSIASFQPEDIGTWQCLASSTSGSATFRTKLEVEGNS